MTWDYDLLNTLINWCMKESIQKRFLRYLNLPIYYMQEYLLTFGSWFWINVFEGPVGENVSLISLPLKTLMLLFK